MIAMFRWLSGSWETARGFLRDDLQHLESALNQRWNATFGDDNILDEGAVNTASLPDNVVTDAKLRDSAGLSVIGRASNTTGDPADIAAGTDGHLLRRSGTTLGFGVAAKAGQHAQTAYKDESNTFTQDQLITKTSAAVLLSLQSSGGSGRNWNIESKTTGRFSVGSDTIADQFSIVAGKVGIGTTGPQSALQVIGTTGDPSGTAGTAAITSFQSGSGTDLVLGSLAGTPFTAWLQHRHATNNNSYFALALNPLGGEVGIGTTSPGSTLDVKGTLRLSGSTSGYVGFAPQAAAGSTTYTLPTGDGTNDQVLTTNGSAVLSWTDKAGGGGGGITSLNSQTGATQSFVNDTNVTISSASNTHTLGWSGTLAKTRQNAQTPYKDELNIFTAFPSVTDTGKAPLTVSGNPSTSPAGTCSGLWIEIGPNATMLGNPVIDDFCAIYAYMRTDTGRPGSGKTLFGFNTVLHAEIINGGLTGVEIDIENESGETTNVPAAWATNGKVGVGAVLGGPTGDGSAAFSCHINYGGGISARWRYGFEAHGCRDGAFYVRKAGNLGDVNPDAAFLNDSDSVYLLRTTGTHTHIISAPTLTVTGKFAQFNSQAFGTGESGPYVAVGRNSSGAGASGLLSIVNKGNTTYYLWVDTNGKLRIGSTGPVEGTGDEGGTVVGAQTA